MPFSLIYQDLGKEYQEYQLMKSDSEEARRGSNIFLKINYNINTARKNIRFGLKTGLKLHHFAFKMFRKLTRRYPEVFCLFNSGRISVYT